MLDLKLDCALLLCYETSASLDVMGGEQTCAGNITEMVYEDIINAEFLVSLRTSVHFPGFAFTKRALYGCGKLDGL